MASSLEQARQRRLASTAAPNANANPRWQPAQSHVGLGANNPKQPLMSAEAEADQNAGRGVTLLLGAIAALVVLMIGGKVLTSPQQRRGVETMGVLEDRPNNAYQLPPSDLGLPERDVPGKRASTARAPKIDDAIDLSSAQEAAEDSLGFAQGYPLELLKDVNGTRSDGVDVDESEEQEDEDDNRPIEARDMARKEREDALAAKQERVAASATSSTAGLRASAPRRIKELGNLLFHDADAYEAAPWIKLHSESEVGTLPKGTWPLLSLHETYYRQHPHKRYVPRLAEVISRETFHRVFRQTATPVIIPFELMRPLGFITQATTLEDLQKRWPYDPATDMSSTTTTYTTNSGRKAKLDLGPAVYAIKNEISLAKIAAGVRNFPRNLQLSEANTATLGISRPPYIQRRRYQPMSLWFATAKDSTKFHHDCCDNIAMMIAGTKRWFLAPPTDYRTFLQIKPVRCEGAHSSLCWGTVPYPLSKDLTAAEKKVVDALNSVVVDLKPGEAMYLPAGWWHYIDNLGSTVMANQWTFGCENVGIALDQDHSRKDRPDFKGCDAVESNEEAWRLKTDTLLKA